MPKYLLNVSYTADGAKGLAKDGGTKRRAAADALVKSVGGQTEAFYFAFGESDVIAIVDMPDAAAAAAASIAVSASGGATCSLTVLLTPEDVDAAVRKTASYTAPGR